MNHVEAGTHENGGSGRKWLCRLGFAGFCFFLVKGLLWLAVPAAVVAYRAMTSQ
ncbi:MAG: hypothetical protein KF745_05630 [Phycisphaeraceae bacterium]|nr:hypothetical protein [Phycisphaeraceae bacterium]